MNRLTSDMNTIDGELSNAFIVFAWQIIGWMSAVVIILSSTPAFLAFGLLLGCGFVYYFFRFLPTSQSLRRLEVSHIASFGVSSTNVETDGIAITTHE
jgi:hypothetical protein